MKFCVYTRSFMEDQYLFYFIQHYINLGFDKIIILKSDGIKYDLPEKYLGLVDIHYTENTGDLLLSTYDYLVKKCDCDWILSVDLDELLILNNSFKNIKDYVEKKLLNDDLINAFYFRWGMIEKIDVESNYNLKFILNNYKIFPNRHTKMMFKRKDLNNVLCSHFAILNNLHIHFENKILNTNEPKHPLNEYSYEESILIHLHVRNIHNLLVKSFHTEFSEKIIYKKNELVAFINNLPSNLNQNDVLTTFIECVGPIVKIAYAHISINFIDTRKYNIFKYDYCILDSNIESEKILNFLKINNINENNYFNFTNELSLRIMNDRTFIF